MTTTMNDNAENSISRQGLTIAQLVNHVHGEICGNDIDIVGGHILDGISPLEEATPSQLSFLYASAPKEYRHLRELARNTKAGAVLVSKYDEKIPSIQILVPHPLHSVINVAPLFCSKPKPPIGIHPTAVIEPSAVVAGSARIGAFCYIGANVKIGEGTILHPHVVIYDSAIIGSHCLIHSQAVIREGVIVQDNCLIQNGVVVGGDGFGYIPVPNQGLERIPHIGTVVLESGVDLGANTTIDRATFGKTVIGRGSKIDNLVMVGHNVKTGKSCIFCGQVGVAGSSVIGDGVILGGQTGVADHLVIGDKVRAAAKTGIGRSIDAATDVAGIPARDASSWRRECAALKRLPDLLRQLTPEEDSTSIED